MRTIDNFGQEVAANAVEVHNQTSPSSTWTVTHNRGRELIWRCTDAAGGDVYPDVDQTNPNVAVITFLYAATGKFIYQ